MCSDQFGVMNWSREDVLRVSGTPKQECHGCDVARVEGLLTVGCLLTCISGPLTEEGQTTKVITTLLLLTVTRPQSNTITRFGPQSKVISRVITSKVKVIWFLGLQILRAPGSLWHMGHPEG